MNLLIIDMQPQFRASEVIIPQVQREINRAIQNKDRIIFMEYAYYCLSSNRSTYSELLDLVKKDPRTFILRKMKDDGSEEFLGLYNHSLKYYGDNKLRVCGVNSSYCVHDTVFGILDKIPEIKINVVADAINCDDVPQTEGQEFYRGKCMLENEINVH